MAADRGGLRTVKVMSERPASDRIGIVSGTGAFGRALAARFASAGVNVIVGSRSPDHARDVVADIANRWPDHTLPLIGSSNNDAASCPAVVLACPAEHMASSVERLAPLLRDRLVIVTGSRLTRGPLGVQVPRTLRPVAEEIAQLLPFSAVSAAFHHLPAGRLADLDDVLDCDVLYCADTGVGMSATERLVATVPGLNPVYAGPLRNAIALETMTAVLADVSRRTKSHRTLRLA